MVNYEYASLFWQDSIDKQWKIEYEGGVITNGNLFSQSIEISESLCSEKELRFGCCEASCLKFKVANIVKPLAGCWLTVSVTIDHYNDNPLIIGRYKVDSDKVTADRRYRDIVAYDAMRDILNAEMAPWYNDLLPSESSTVTMRQFRESFAAHFGIEEVLPEGGLVNDDMTVEKTIELEQISGKDIIMAICEINGCFGHIGRDGKFHYIYLPRGIQALYPAENLYPAEDLYPTDPVTKEVGGGTYISCKYEDFITSDITQLQIRQEENDIGLIYGSPGNAYIMEGNFLVYGKSSAQLQVIAKNLMGKISSVTYQPFDCEAAGNPCLEIGDPVRLVTKYELIETYILERTLKGIQALRDTYKSQGVERYAEKVNGVHRSIQQLKGKANILTRTIEETRLEMIDLGAGLSNTITATAGELRAELKNEVDGLNSTIQVTAGQIRGELQDVNEGLSNTITATAKELDVKIKNTSDGLETQINTTAEGIRADVSKTYETKENAGTQYTSIRNSVKLESDRISAEITRAEKSEQELSGAITQTEKTLNTKIEAAEGKINLSVSQKIEEAKQYADDAAGAVDSKLGNYSTTTQMNAAIKVETDKVSQSVSKTYQTKSAAQEEYTRLSSSITSSAGEIRAEVSASYETKSNATSNYNSLSGRITVNAGKIDLKVAKGSVSSEISAEAGEVFFRSNRITIESDNFKLTKTGQVTASGSFTSKIVRERQEIENEQIVTYEDTYENVITESNVNIKRNNILIGRFSARTTDDNKYEGVEILGTPLVAIGFTDGTAGYVCADKTKTKYLYRHNFLGDTCFDSPATCLKGLTVAGQELKVNNVNLNIYQSGVVVGSLWAHGNQNGLVLNGRHAITVQSPGGTYTCCDSTILSWPHNFLGDVYISGNLHSTKHITGGTYTIDGNEIRSSTGVHLIPNNANVYLHGNSVMCIKTDLTTYTPILASAFTVKSTRASKENFRAMTDQDAMKLLDIACWHFDYINGAKGQSGFIADDLEKIFPEACTYFKDEGNEEEKLFGLDYSKFTPYIVRMLQMHQSKIESIEERMMTA